MSALRMDPSKPWRFADTTRPDGTTHIEYRIWLSGAARQAPDDAFEDEKVGEKFVEKCFSVQKSNESEIVGFIRKMAIIYAFAR